MRRAVSHWRGGWRIGCPGGRGWWILVVGQAACSGSSPRSSGAGRTGSWWMPTLRYWMRRSGARLRGRGGEGSLPRRRAMSCWCLRRTGCGGCSAVVRELAAPSLAQASWPALRCQSSDGWHGRPQPGHDEMQGRSVDAFVCSALLDLVSRMWLSRLCDLLTVPFLACLTVDGRDVWRPHHPYDALVRTAFRRDTRRDKGFGPALGIAAPRALTACNLVTASAPSDWHIPRTALRMQRALIDGTADAARSARPAQADAITAWQEARLRQALRGRLAITIGHRDILALPPGG